MASIVVELDVSRIRQQLAQLDGDLSRLGRDTGLDGLDQSLDSSSAAAGRASQSFITFGQVLATVGSVLGAKQILDFANSFTEVENRVKAVLLPTQDLGATVERLADVSRNTGLQFEAVTTTFQRFTFATRDLGVSQAEVIDLVQTLANGFRVYGATATEAASVSLQLGQALASGTLQGDELRSVLENFPPLVQAIADVMGIAAGEVKKFASEGKVSSAIVVEALQSIKDETDLAAESLERTLPQAVQGLRTSFIQLVGDLDDLIGFSERFVGVIDFISDGILDLRDEVNQLALEFGRATGPLEAFEVLANNIFGNLVDQVGDAIVNFLTLFDTFNEFIGIDDGFVAIAEAIFNIDETVAGLITGVGDLVNSFLGLFDSAAAFTTITDGAVLLTETLRQVGEDIVALGGQFLEIFNLGDLFASQRDGAVLFIETIRQVADDVVELGRQFLEFTGITGIFDTIGEKIEFVRQKVADLIAAMAELPVVGRLFGETAAPVDELGTAVEGATISFDEFGGSIAAAAAAAADGVVDFGTFGRVADDVGVALATTAEGSDVARDALIELTAELARAEVAQSKLGGGAGDYRDAIESVADATRDSAEATKAASEQLKDYGDLLDVVRQNGIQAARVEEQLKIARQEQVNVTEVLQKAEEERAKQREIAIGGIADSIADAVGGSSLEVEQFFDNFSQLFNDLGGAADLTLGGIADTISESLGISTDQLDGFFGLAVEGLDIFGIEFEDIFGKKLTGVIERFAGLSANEISALGSIMSGVFSVFSGEALASIGGVSGAFSSLAAGATAAFSTISAAASAAVVALGPIGLTILAIVAAVAVLILVFGDLKSALEFLIDLFTKLGGDGSTAAKILQIAFAPVILPILAIVEVVKFLIDLFNGDLSSSGSAVAKLLFVVFAPIVIPIKLMIEAVEFLIGLFSDLGSAGDAVAKLLALVLAPIVIPIKLIIEAVEFLIGLFTGSGGLGEAISFIGELFSTVFGAILSLVTGVFEALTSIIQVFFELAQGVLNAFVAAWTAAFDIVLSIFSTVFSAITGLFEAWLGAAQSILSTFISVWTSTFNAALSLAQSVFSAIVSAASAMLSALLGILSSLASAASSAFSSILSAATSAFSAIISAASSMASSVIGALNSIASVGASVFGSLVGAASSAFGSIVSAASSAAGSVGSALGGISRGIAGVVSDIAGLGGSFNDGPFSVGNIASKVASPVKSGFKKIKSLFAEGGVIEDTVALSGPDADGKAFRTGGILGSTTDIFGADNITPTSRLGVAGEAGPEAILPLTQTSRGLGVTATGLDGGVTKIFIINGVDRAVTDRLEQQALELDASIEFRSGIAAERVLLGGF